MRIGVRLVLVSLALALGVALAGCKGVTPPSIREEPSTSSPVSAVEPSPSAESSPATGETSAAPAPAKPASGEYAASLTSAGVAVGAELQRTDQWLLGGKVWAMTISGKPDDTTDQPKVQLIAVNVNGAQRVIFELPASEPKGVASLQGAFTVPVPSATVQLIVTTSLRSGAGPGPELRVDLGDVPTVKTLTPGTSAQY
ncbi:MAG TPA: hypothetical protein VGK50_02535 [Coriobacteriia bacterium]